MERKFAQQALSRVRDERQAARFALSCVLGNLNSHAEAMVAARITEGQLRRCMRNLEVTFVLRLFAEFEGVLRDYWRNGVGRSTKPTMRLLMNRIAAVRGTPDKTRDLAHEIREFRNDIIHENLRRPRLDLPECAKRLGRYLSWLPPAW